MKFTSYLSMALLMGSMTAGAVANAAPVAKAPSTGASGTIYAYNSDYAQVNYKGLYELALNESSQPAFIWADELAYPNGIGERGNTIQMYNGWMRNGRLCGFASYYPNYSASYYHYVERDLENGDVLVDEPVYLNDIHLDYTNFFVSAVYIPETGKIYGYGFNKNKDAYAFKSAPVDNPGNATIIRDLKYNSGPWLPTLCYNPDRGELVGITTGGVMMNVNINNGVTTELYKIEYPAGGANAQIDGMCYYPQNGTYITNYTRTYNGYEDYSYLYEVDPYKGVSTPIANYGYAYQFGWLLCIDGDAPVAAEAPVQVTDLAFDFPNDALSGNITFTLPNKTESGATISSDLQWEVYMDGSLLQEGNGAPASKVSVPATVRKGFHLVRVSVINSGNKGMSTVKSYLFGGDIPVSAKNVRLDGTTLKWDIETIGESGNELNAADVEYNIYCGTEKIATVKNNSYDLASYIANLQKGELKPYSFSVQVAYHGNTSAQVSTDVYVYGKAMEMPVEIYPDEAQSNLCVIEDADGNKETWTYLANTSVGDVFQSGFGPGTEDWIFLPKFTPGDAKSLAVSLRAALADKDMTGASLSIAIGTKPESREMKKVIVPDYTFSMLSTRMLNLSGQIYLDGELANASELYVGVCVKNGSQTSPINMNNITIKAGSVASEGPKAVEDLKVTYEAGKSCTLSFTMPKKTLDGKDIPASTEIKTTVAAASNVEFTGKPGEKIEQTITTKDGDNLISVTPYIGETMGQPAYYYIFTGNDVPGLVENLRMEFSEDNLGVVVRWDPPTKGYNGGAVSNKGYTYSVFMYSEADGGFLPVTETGVDQCYADTELPQGTSLMSLEMAVVASNNVGTCPDMARIVGQIGEPYSTSMVENFDGDQIIYTPLIPYGAEGLVWSWTHPDKYDVKYASDLGDAYVARVMLDQPTEARLDLPKFSTKDWNSGSLNLYMWNGKDAAPVEVYAMAYPESAFTRVATVRAGDSEEYKKYVLPFNNSILHKGWADFSLRAQFTGKDQIFILTEYSIMGGAGVDDVKTVYGTVRGTNGEIRVCGYENEMISVYTLDGRLAKQQRGDADITRIATAPGIYVVKVGNQTEKVVVR